MLNHLSYKFVAAIAVLLLALMIAGFLLLNRQLVRNTEYDTRKTIS